MSFETILTDRPQPHTYRIRLNRPERRNAQNFSMLYEIDAAIKEACEDSEISVIILGAEGPDFSAGHDLAFSDDHNPGPYDRHGLWAGFREPGAEGFYSIEKESYLDLTERWRNCPKPTIAQVQGRVIAGGNMLVWACDLIVAAQNASFQDNTIDMGMPGAEFFNHPYEMPIRLAKEFLFTAEVVDAAEAHRRGMVNHVVELEALEAETLKLAARIAEKPLFALKQAKEAMNKAQDQMGRPHAMAHSFAQHQLAHMHNVLMHNFPIDFSRLHPKMQEAIRAYIKESGGDPFGFRPKQEAAE